MICHRCVSLERCPEEHPEEYREPRTSKTTTFNLITLGAPYLPILATIGTIKEELRQSEPFGEQIWSEHAQPCGQA